MTASKMPKGNVEEKPDLAWYLGVSTKLGLPPRCPIAKTQLCPRYYESLEALGRTGRFTSIPAEQAALLEQKWKPFMSVVAEEEPQADEKSVDHFCPEVSYDRFGYFASYMHEYIDEVDRDSMHEFYERRGIADQFDARWCWITPRHYTECREYSIHGTFAAGKPSKTRDQRKEASAKDRWQAFARDNFTCQYCGRKPPEVTLHADHKRSIRDGGSSELDNLVTACEDCNAGKGSSSR